MTELTPKQMEVRDYIAQQLAAGQACPSRREVAQHFGFASPHAASCHIVALIRKGALVRDSNKARWLRLPESGRFQRRRIAQIPIFGSIPAGLAEERQQEAVGCVAVDLDEL